MRERLRRVLCALACALSLLCLGSVAASSQWQTPGLVAERGEAWHKLGEGQLRWFGFRVYEAALWAPHGQWRADQPFALEIRYLRDIPSARLVQASVDEMKRLGVAEESRIDVWRADLERAFPDVVSGDVIVGLRDDDGSAVFFHRGEQTVRIAEPGFADAFFAIWLDERTREPGLRERLFGQRDDG
jgi:hypothetical protein